MKKMLFISVIFIAALFLLTPAIPASQYSMVNQAREDQIKQELNLPIETDLKIESLSDIKDILSESSGTFSKSIFQNLITLIKGDASSSDPDGGGDVEPQALIFLGLFVYTVLIWTMFKIVLFVFSDIGSFFGSIIDNIKSKINNFFTTIVEFILNILTFIGSVAAGLLTVLAAVVGGVLNVLVTIILSILALGSGALKLVINIIIFIIFGIIKIAGLAWDSIGTIVALFFNILLLIFQTIFPNFNGV